MAKIQLLFANRTYDTAKQVVSENQIVVGYEYKGHRTKRIKEDEDENDVKVPYNGMFEMFA